MPTLDLSAAQPIGNPCPECDRQELVVSFTGKVSSTIKKGKNGKATVELAMKKGSTITVRCQSCGWTKAKAVGRG